MKKMARIDKTDINYNMIQTKELIKLLING